VKLPGLRTARMQRFLTQAELAERAGMSETTVNRLENQLQEARISTVRRLAEALAVEPERLIWDEGETGKAAA
jgi:transcriptional regulator with XRE-family HTH domain